MTAGASDWHCRYCGSRLLVSGPCVVCGGNAARAGLLIGALGTRIVYLGAADRVAGGRISAFSMMFDPRLRSFPPRRDRGYAALRRNTHVDAGYCLDAPEVMPAGSVLWEPAPDYALDPGEDPETAGYPRQRVVLREAIDGSHGEIGPVPLDI